MAIHLKSRYVSLKAVQTYFIITQYVYLPKKKDLAIFVTSKVLLIAKGGAKLVRTLITNELIFPLCFVLQFKIGMTMIPCQQKFCHTTKIKGLRDIVVKSSKLILAGRASGIYFHANILLSVQNGTYKAHC